LREAVRGVTERVWENRLQALYCLAPGGRPVWTDLQRFLSGF